MKPDNNENLEGMFEIFGGSEPAEASAEDIRQGDRIFKDCTAPQPPQELIAAAKAKVARELSVRKVAVFRVTTGKKLTVIKITAGKVAAVAAVLLVVAAIGLKIFDTGPNSDATPTVALIPAAIWDSNDIAADDAVLAALIAEVNEIEGQALALQLGENGSNGYSDLSELEMDYVETNSDFWKG
jgi:hypothetical protein